MQLFIYLLLTLLPLSVVAEKSTPFIKWKIELIQIISTEDLKVRYDTMQHQKVGVFLEDSSFHVTKGNQRTIYDFQKEKIYFLDIKSNTYDETSLYAEIDFRRTEFLNRLKLKEFLATKGIENKVGSLFDLESLFGIANRLDSLSINIETRDQEGFYNYNSRANSLAKFKFSKDSLKDKKHIFEKYLLYETQIHPNIIKAALENNLIPEKISFTFFNSGKQYLVNYTLEEVNRQVSASDFGHNYYLFKYKSKNELLTSINKVYGFVHNNKVKQETYDECISNFQYALKKKNYINAFLILIENNLSTNKDFQEQFDLLKSEGKKDKNYQEFLLALFEPETDEELKAKIEVLEKLRKNRKTEKPYLIDAFLASYYNGLGDQAKAFELFHNVIKANPYITSIYSDIGNLYTEKYNMRIAWKCYEIAIKLNPKHLASQKLILKKAYLKKKYPNFFM